PASGVETNAFLRGGNTDYHTGLICHQGATFPTGKSHPARAPGTDIIMTVKILKMLQIKNLAVSGRAGNPDFAYRESVYVNRVFFTLITKGSAPAAEADTYCDRFKRKPQSSVCAAFLGRKKARRYPQREQRKYDCPQMIHLFSFGCCRRTIKIAPGVAIGRRSYIDCLGGAAEC